MQVNKQQITLMLNKESVSHKWFDLPDSVALNIYDKTIDAALFSFVLEQMKGQFVSIHRTSEFIQVKRYND